VTSSADTPTKSSEPPTDEKPDGADEKPDRADEKPDESAGGPADEAQAPTSEPPKRQSDEADDKGESEKPAPPAPSEPPPSTASSTAAKSTPPSAQKKGLLPAAKRFFLMKERVDEANAQAFKSGDAGFEYYELALRTLDGVETLLEVADREDSALLLARDATVLGVRARLLHDQPERATSLKAADGPALWSSIESSSLLTALGADGRKHVHFIVESADVTALAGLSKLERRQYLDSLKKFTRPLIEQLQKEAERAGTVRLIRRLRIGGALLVVLAIFAGLYYGGRAISRSFASNAALNRPVVQSSSFKIKKFIPARTVDGDRATLGGHTKLQPNPWIQIDLGKTRSIHRIVVTNRLDNFKRFGKRAVPLLIEVSTDGKKFTEFARRTEVFKTWEAKRSSMDARFVRLKALKKTELHFNEVEVY